MWTDLDNQLVHTTLIVWCRDIRQSAFVMYIILFIIFCSHFVAGDSRDDYVSDKTLSDAAAQISAEQMTEFVVESTNINEGMLTNIKASVNQDVYRMVYECLYRWRNIKECNGQDASRELEDLLERAVSPATRKQLQNRARQLALLNIMCICCVSSNDLESNLLENIEPNMPPESSKIYQHQHSLSLKSLPTDPKKFMSISGNTQFFS